jgi:NADPH-dependent 2,4-dienoyl-CoA reductase/sulfur reductase-like enzyme
MINVHRVLPGKRVVMLGSGNVGLIVAYQLLQAGAEVVALVEAMPNIGGYGVHAAKIRRAGVPILVGTTIARAFGRGQVEGVVLARLDEKFQPVPGGETTLAVDTLGNRLGQGGGFYDRALAHANPAALIAAIVHDNELLDAAVEPVPVEPHDRPVAAALSPSRWHPFDPFVDVR